MTITRDSIRKYLKKEYPHITVTNRTLLTYFVPAHITRFLMSKFLENIQKGMGATMDAALVDALHKTKFETLEEILPFLLCMKESRPTPTPKANPKTSSQNSWVYTPQRQWPFPTGLKD